MGWEGMYPDRKGIWQGMGDRRRRKENSVSGDPGSR